jgi:type IV secretion system protein VirB4
MLRIDQVHKRRAEEFGLLGRRRFGRHRRAPARRRGEGLTPLGRHQRESGFASFSPLADSNLANADICRSQKAKAFRGVRRFSRATSYVLTFAWLPPADDAARAEGFLYEGTAGAEVATGRDALRNFIDRTERVLDQIEAFVPEARWLDDAETLTFLHSTVSTRRHLVRVPETPMHLDALVADQPLVGGLAPRLGDVHLRVLTIIGFLSATFPGILDELNALAFEYRSCTRAICLDRTDAQKLLTRIRRQWFAKRKSIAAILKEVMTNEQSVLLDSDAANKAADADEALQELGQDIAGWAYVTATVTVWDEDARAADDKLRLVEKVIQSRDFTVIREGVNAVEAWLGSLPGHLHANVRQPPISTLNLAHIVPISAVWAGPERNEHLGGPPLFHARTEGATPFRFSLHIGDVGHTLVIGPTGAGKSVLLALMALQFRRYAGARVFAFDFGGSIRSAAIAVLDALQIYSSRFGTGYAKSTGAQREGSTYG